MHLKSWSKISSIEEIPLAGSYRLQNVPISHQCLLLCPPCPLPMFPLRTHMQSLLSLTMSNPYCPFYIPFLCPPSMSCPVSPPYVSSYPPMFPYVPSYVLFLCPLPMSSPLSPCQLLCPPPLSPCPPLCPSLYFLFCCPLLCFPIPPMSPPMSLMSSPYVPSYVPYVPFLCSCPCSSYVSFYVPSICPLLMFPPVSPPMSLPQLCHPMTPAYVPCYVPCYVPYYVSHYDWLRLTTNQSIRNSIQPKLIYMFMHCTTTNHIAVL